MQESNLWRVTKNGYANYLDLLTAESVLSAELKFD